MALNSGQVAFREHAPRRPFFARGYGREALSYVRGSTRICVAAV